MALVNALPNFNSPNKFYLNRAIALQRFPTFARLPFEHQSLNLGFKKLWKNFPELFFCLSWLAGCATNDLISNL
jgi:hypothetical protein